MLDQLSRIRKVGSEVFGVRGVFGVGRVDGVGWVGGVGLVGGSGEVEVVVGVLFLWLGRREVAK